MFLGRCWLALWVYVFFFIFFCVWRRSCGFWIVLCPLVGVSSSVGLSGLMRCFVACCAVSGSRFPDDSSIVLVFQVCCFSCVFFLHFLCVATFLWILDCIVSVCWRVLFCGVVWSHALFPGLLRCFPALRFSDGSSMVLALDFFFFFFFFFRFFFRCCFFFYCAATFLWILDCIVSVCWRILFCGVVWCHALFPGLLRCFPALRFPDDSSIVMAFEVFFCCFFFLLYFFRDCFFFGVRRRSCGFWIILCPFVGVSSSVRLSGLMRCFLACCAVSRLFGSLMILRSSWLALCVCLFFDMCFFF